MPSPFIESQFDYISFFYGLAFLVLAAVCHVMHCPMTQRLPWTWLAVFGLLHGIYEWLEMVVPSIGDSDAFAMARLVLMAISFVCLLEFGRLGSVASRGNPIGRWIYLPLSVVALSGCAAADLSALNATVRYAFGLTGGLWAAWALAKASRAEKIAPRPLAVAAAAMAAYAMATGFIVPPSTFFPASTLNYPAVIAWTGIPIQLIRGGIAVLTAAAVWRYCEAVTRRQSIVEIGQDKNSPHGSHLTMALILVVTAGWGFTEWVSREVEAEARSRAVILAKTAVAGIDLDHTCNFIASGFDASHPDCDKLRRQLNHIQHADAKIRRLHLVFWKEGNDRFVLDADGDERRGDPTRRLPSEPSAQPLLEVFAKGEATSLGLCRTPSGDCFFGYAPILAPGVARPVAVLVVDIDAGQWWRQKIAAYRMMPIGIVLSISLVAIVFFISRQRMWERTQYVSIRERQLAGAQRIAHIGSWTHDLAADRVTWSEEMYRICGIEPRWDDLSRNSLEHMLPLDTLAKLRAVAQEAIVKNAGYETVLRITRPDRSVRHVNVKVEPTWAADGTVIQLYGTVQDITDRKQVWNELRKLTIAVEQSPAIIMITDGDGRIEYVNPKFTKLTGYTPEDARGRTPRILKSEKTSRAEYEALWQTILAGKEWRGEFYNKKKSGEYYWERAIIAPVTDADGAITHFIAIKEDITDLKLAQAEREKALAEVQDLYDKAPCGYHSLDAEGYFVRINDTELSWLGYAREELIGAKRFTDLLTAKSREAFQRDFPAFMEIGCVQDLEFDMVRKDGSIMPVILNASAVKDSLGNYVTCRSTIFDITDRKWTEKALQESERKLRLILDSTAEGIYGIDLEGCCTFCNPASLRLLGLQRPDQMLGKNPHRLIHHSRPDGSPFPIEECPAFRAFRREELVHVDNDVYRRADGTDLPVEYWSYPQYRDGEVVGAVVTFVDITARQKALNGLQQARDDLEKANRELARASDVKSRFLAMVSHEIRNPLNAIIGLTAMMLDTRLDAEQRDFLETIRASSEILLVLINDVLDFSKIEADKIELECRTFDLTQCVKESLGLVRGLAAKKRLDTTYLADDSLPRLFVGDAVRLRQILVNLLSNAVKFTEQGGIAVSVSGQRRDHHQYEIRFAVRDTGLGIPPDRQDHLFQSFSQMDSSTHRQFGGTGLGLVISRRLCELMGGRMWVESEGIPGQGSTFHFTIVVPVGFEQDLPPEGAADLRGAEEAVVTANQEPVGTTPGGDFAVSHPLRILVAEDNPINQKVTIKMLAKMGYKADAANDGAEAVEAVRRTPYDVVLMDCLMPRLDGYEATRQIRQFEQAARRPPIHIVAVTGTVMQGDREACLAAGMSEYVSKPVRADALAQLLERCRPVERTADRAAANAPLPASAPPLPAGAIPGIGNEERRQP